MLMPFTLDPVSAKQITERVKSAKKKLPLLPLYVLLTSDTLLT